MTDRASVVLWRFAPMIYGPTVLFALGEGAVVPLIPVLATGLGADVATSALISAGLVVGQLAGNLPAGWAVSRIGERLTMTLSGLVALAGVIGLALAPSLPVLAGSVLLVGFCAASFGLARHSFMTMRVPLSFRARALALLGGSFRLGMFVGPFVAAGLVIAFGQERAAIWFFAACLVATVALVFLGPDPEHEAAAPSPPSDEADTGEAVLGTPTPSRGVLATMRAHRVVLSRIGLAAAALSAVRSARQVVLPLWGVSIGLDAGTIALVVGVSGALDFALFYASGQVMDRFGRLWAALPAMVLMGAGFLALAPTHDLPRAAMWYALFGAVLGVGNGLSSGILMTLGADLAPIGDPAPFLGSWRTLTDAGGAIAPVLVAAVTAVSGLAVGTAVMGVVALAGAAGFLRWVPRFLSRPGP